LGGRGIGTELRGLGTALATDVLMGAGGGTLAIPAVGLDAEQVVGVTAAVALDLAPAPAGLQRGLGDQGAGVHAQLLRRGLGLVPDAGDETFRAALGELSGSLRRGTSGGHCAFRTGHQLAYEGVHRRAL